MEVIILAAGRGERMLPLTSEIPKPLLKVGSETLISRLVRQFSERGLTKFKIVLGHRRESVEKHFNGVPGRFEFIYNARYAEDVNINSVYLAFDPSVDALIVEADLLLEEAAMDRLVAEVRSEDSIWFTRGPFTSKQIGGILHTDQNGWIDDIKIVREFSVEQSSYKKLLGVMKIGREQGQVYGRFLQQSVQRTLGQYYLMPWIENLRELPCRAVDIEPFLALSFNTPSEYFESLQRLSEVEK